MAVDDPAFAIKRSNSKVSIRVDITTVACARASTLHEHRDLTAPIFPSERNFKLTDKDIGYSARVDMQKALGLAVECRERVR